MHTKSSENELIIKDLLSTNGLNRNQIEERLKLIELKKIEGLAFDEEDENKLSRIVAKLSNPQVINLSEKYIGNDTIKEVSEKLIPNYDVVIKKKPPWDAIRISGKDVNFLKKQNVKIVFDKEDDVEKYQIDFDQEFLNCKMKILIKDDKFEIHFLSTFLQGKIGGGGSLPHTEEIQMAIFKQLIEKYPDVRKKLVSANKINFLQNDIVEKTSRNYIGEYLKLNSDGTVDKSLLESTPVSGNSYNFLNHLKKEYGLVIKEIRSPKVIISDCPHPELSIKQTFVNKPSTTLLQSKTQPSQSVTASCLSFFLAYFK